MCGVCAVHWCCHLIIEKLVICALRVHLLTINNADAYLPLSVPQKSHHKRLSARSAPLLRSRGKTALCLSGFASERIIRSNTMPSVVTGAEPSLDSKEIDVFIVSA